MMSAVSAMRPCRMPARMRDCTNRRRNSRTPRGSDADAAGVAAEMIAPSIPRSVEATTDGPTVSGRDSTRLVTTRSHRKVFQWRETAVSPLARWVGRASGRVHCAPPAGWTRQPAPRTAARSPGLPLDGLVFAPLVPGLDTIIRVGLNDRDHVPETGRAVTGKPALVACISAILPLRPGDAIVTGTPGGVGMRRTPPLSMQPGDVAEAETGGVRRRAEPAGP